MKYEVLQNINGTWENTWHDGDEKQTFNSEEEARTELNEFFADVHRGIQEGNITSGAYNIADYRIARIERNILCGVDENGQDNECFVCGKVRHALEIERYYSKDPEADGDTVELCENCREEFEDDDPDETLNLADDTIEEEIFQRLFDWASRKEKETEERRRKRLTKKDIVTAIKQKDITKEDVITAVFEAL